MPDPVRILYIDDDAGLARLVQRALGAARASRVDHAATGAEGLRRLARRALRCRGPRPQISAARRARGPRRIRAPAGAPPVIYVTGSEDARVAVAALKAGAVDYVWKDVQGHFRELLGAGDRRRADAGAAAARERGGRAADPRGQGPGRAAAGRGQPSRRQLAGAGRLAGQAAGHAVPDRRGARRPCSEMQARIVAIAGIHRRLYTSHDVRFVEHGCLSQQPGRGAGPGDERRRPRARDRAGRPSRHAACPPTRRCRSA